MIKDELEVLRLLFAQVETQIDALEREALPDQVRSPLGIFGQCNRMRANLADSRLAAADLVRSI